MRLPLTICGFNPIIPRPLSRPKELNSWYSTVDNKPRRNGKGARGFSFQCESRCPFPPRSPGFIRSSRSIVSPAFHEGNSRARFARAEQIPPFQGLRSRLFWTSGETKFFCPMEEGQEHFTSLSPRSRRRDCVSLARVVWSGVFEYLKEGSSVEERIIYPIVINI